MRHYLNIRILWAVLTEFATIGPFELDWKAQQYKCRISQMVTFGLLASLQALNLFWLFLIFRISCNYIITRIPKDETSDIEGDETNDEDDILDAALEHTGISITYGEMNGHVKEKGHLCPMVTSMEQHEVSDMEPIKKSQ